MNRTETADATRMTSDCLRQNNLLVIHLRLLNLDNSIETYVPEIPETATPRTTFHELTEQLIIKNGYLMYQIYQVGACTSASRCS